MTADTHPENDSVPTICGNCKHYHRIKKYCTKRYNNKTQHGFLEVAFGSSCIEWEQSKIKKMHTTGFYLLTDYFENAKEIHRLQPFFYDRNKIFWLWNCDNYKWEISDEIDLLNILNDELSLHGQVVVGNVRNNYINSFKSVGRKNIPLDAPKTWVQFDDVIVDIKTSEHFKASSDFLVCNPIPWKLGDNSDTPVMDKLFEEWVGKDKVQSLYEIIAYCCLADYPIHLIFCLVGCGRNGKSKFLGLLRKFLGDGNICSTELDTLTDSRFESFKLFKKTACIMGETNFGTLSKTSMLKKLTGQDLINMEMKNKSPFDAENYAKILIASNSLPTSSDTSEGFYRRWMIIDFNNTFAEGNDVLKQIPTEEYSALARKVINILPVLLERGSFTGQGNIEERKKAYIMASNPLPFFLDIFCVRANYEFMLRNDLYQAYLKFLIKNKRRAVSRKEFNESLDAEGISQRRTTKDGESGYYVFGLTLNTNWETMI